MIDNKKVGIRLRHLEQQQQERKRDVSPNTANRKKIFEKLPYQRIGGERQNLEEKLKSPKIVAEPDRDSSEVEKLIENLKRKSMEVELRDNMIKSLNLQIDELKRDLKVKQREIVRLNGEIEKMERINRMSKNVQKEPHVFQSFRDPAPVGTFARQQRSQEFDKYRSKAPYDQIANNLREEVTMMNIPSRQHNIDNSPIEEPEILSPFMALTNHKNTANSQTHNGFEPNARDHAHTFHSTSNKSSSVSDVSSKTAKNTLANPFERQSQSPFQAVNSSTSSAFSKKLGDFDQKRPSNNLSIDKFNIFNQESARTELRSQNNLAIQDSRQFKFEDFEKSDFRQF